MKRFLLYWLPVFLWMGIIFYASSQPYEKQDLRPTLSSNLNLNTVENLFSSISFHYAGDEISIEALGAAHFLEFFIRKAAHFFTYFVLGFLIYRALDRYLLNNRLTFMTSWILTILYAISDEVHQGYTPNRSPHMEDVMIDTIGGLIGIMIALFIYRKIRTKKNLV
ncbi:VanZ family protein [Fictibacillus phosphorivorans]|uniref:VanZ family protein n=1 Tax=Fictibacillus phosphorivorans TaxID=1221500 RepID=UPI001642BE2E|nr:VanZ family protein [Fictibacillus phosphorivorans]